jgi:hypothetical protein
MNSTALGNTRTFGNLKGRHVLAAGLASLVAVVAIGAAAWLSDGSGGSRSASTAGAIPSGTMVEPEVTFYLVNTQAEADVILQGELDAAGIRHQSGLAEGDYRFEVIVGNDTLTNRAVADAVAIRADMGLPEIKVIDLR